MLEKRWSTWTLGLDAAHIHRPVLGCVKKSPVEYDRP
jgi:hypothetical protein